MERLVTTWPRGGGPIPVGFGDGIGLDVDYVEWPPVVVSFVGLEGDIMQNAGVRKGDWLVHAEVPGRDGVDTIPLARTPRTGGTHSLGGAPWW